MLAGQGDPRGETALDRLAIHLRGSDELPVRILEKILAGVEGVLVTPGSFSAAAADFAPHDVTFYLRELAAAYHSYYDSERILVDDDTVKKARLALVAACAQVLHNGLAVLGVGAPRKM